MVCQAGELEDWFLVERTYCNASRWEIGHCVQEKMTTISTLWMKCCIAASSLRSCSSPWSTLITSGLTGLAAVPVFHHPPQPSWMFYSSVVKGSKSFYPDFHLMSIKWSEDFVVQASDIPDHDFIITTVHTDVRDLRCNMSILGWQASFQMEGCGCCASFSLDWNHIEDI